MDTTSLERGGTPRGGVGDGDESGLPEKSLYEES